MHVINGQRRVALVFNSIDRGFVVDQEPRALWAREFRGLHVAHVKKLCRLRGWTWVSYF